MKFKNNELNFCDYCLVTKENAVEKITNTQCVLCKKYFCVKCNPDDYSHYGHIPHQLRLKACHKCYSVIMEAHYRDSGFDAKNAWKKYPKKDIHASGSTSAIHLGEIMHAIFDKHIENAKKESETVLKDLYTSSFKFLKERDKKISK